MSYSDNVKSMRSVKLGDKTFVNADQVASNLDALEAKVDNLPKCYIPKGSCTVAFANAQTYAAEQVGWVYNLSDAGTVNNGIGGEPFKVKAGDNIVWINNGDETTPAYCWDKLSSGAAIYTGEGAIVVNNETEKIAISLDKAAENDGKVIGDETTIGDIIGWLGGTIAPSDWAFRIGGSYYTTFAAAISAAQDGDTISFRGDTTFSGVEIAKDNASGAGITLDLGGHVLTAAGARDFDVNGTKLVIANGTVNAATIKVYGGSDLTVASDATVNVTYQEGVFVDGSTLNVYGTVCQQVQNAGAINADSPASATVINIEEGAVVKTLSDNNTYGVAAYGDNITVNMNGGTIDAQSYGFEVDPLVVLNLTRGVVKTQFNINVYEGSSLHDPLTEENCGVYFREKESEAGQYKLADLCATGYGPVKVGGTGEYANYWKIAANA